jgi:uncharacterized SAM-binding protein YcdF (DUF218 family)
MITRLLSLLLLGYALGFVWFATTLDGPASPADKIEAAVVLTGGVGRIEHGLAVLEAGEVKRMLVAGADPAVTKPDLVRRLGRGSKRLVACCVDLGSESVDTRSNAEEAQRWLVKRNYKSLRLITSDWHMHRAGYEFGKVLGPDYRIVRDGVRTEPRLPTLFGEYNKLVLRRLAVWLDL